MITKLIFSCAVIWIFCLKCNAQLTDERFTDIKYRCISNILDTIDAYYLIDSETKVIANAQIHQIAYQFLRGYISLITSDTLKFDSTLVAKLMSDYDDTIDTYQFKFDSLTHFAEYLDFETVGLRPAEPYPNKTKILYVSISLPIGGWEILYPDPYLLRTNEIDSLNYLREVIIPVTTMYCNYITHEVVESKYLFYFTINLNKNAIIINLKHVNNYVNNVKGR